MAFETRLSPLSNWHVELDKSGSPKRYSIVANVEEYDVLYELTIKDSKWHPKITADGHVTFRPIRGFDTAEDAHAALLKRFGVL